jgi:hypothetical protein
MTTEELIAARLPVDQLLRVLRMLHQLKTPALLAALGVAKTGKSNLMTTKISGTWMPASVIWLE